MTDERRARTPRKLADLDAFVRLKMLGKQSGLVVAHQDIEHAFTGLAGVNTLHHGSVAGDDDFGNVDAAPADGIYPTSETQARCTQGGSRLRTIEERKVNRWDYTLRRGFQLPEWYLIPGSETFELCQTLTCCPTCAILQNRAGDPGPPPRSWHRQTSG